MGDVPENMMSSANKYIIRGSIAITSTLLLVCLGIIIYIGPWINCDILEGLLSLNNYLGGMGFHQRIELDDDNIIKQGILSYWPPGQYVYSWAVAQLLHINIGNAVTVTSFLFLIAGFICYYYLLLHFRFSKKVIFFTILVLTYQRFFTGLFLKMNAVDVYLIFFSCATVLLYEKYYTVNKQQHRAGILLLMLLTFLGGLYSKNSFTLLIISVTAYYVVTHFIKAVKSESGKIKKLFVSGLPALVALTSVLVFYFLLYAQNRTPFSQRVEANTLQLSFLKILNIFIKPAIQSLGACFSLDAFMLHIPSVQNSYFSYFTDFTWQGIAGSLIMLVPLVYAVVWFHKKSESKSFALIAAIAVIVYTGFFAVAIIRQTDVYAEDRLFLPMILLVIPIYASAFFEGSKWLKLSMSVFIAVSLFFGIASIPNTFQYYKNSTEINSSKLMSGFIVHTPYDDFKELKKIGNAIKDNYTDNNLIMAFNAERFFALNVNVPCIMYNAVKNADVNDIVAKNTSFFHRHQIRYMTIVLPSADKPLNIDESLLIKKETYNIYTLYIISTIPLGN